MKTLAWQLAVLLCISVAPHALAQDDASRANYYGRPGYPTITVYVVGGVPQPGVWRVEQGVDFVEFLSVINASRQETQQAETRTRVLLRLFRLQSERREEIYKATLEDAIMQNQPHPGLVDGDVLFVDSRVSRRLTIRTGASVVGAISSLLLLAIRLSNL
jgi:hypothetical protein